MIRTAAAIGRCHRTLSDSLTPSFLIGSLSLGVLQGRPLLLGPGIRQGFGKAGDGEIRRRRAIDDRCDDARRKEGERSFAGVTGLVFKAIRGRDGCTREFGRGRYENLSGAISWLTFSAGGAAEVRRSRRDWRRELAESTICSQQKPRSFRCSAQPAGSRGVRRINVWALSCGGFRPLMMAVVMSGASQGRRRRE